MNCNGFVWRRENWLAAVCDWLSGYLLFDIVGYLRFDMSVRTNCVFVAVQNCFLMSRCTQELVYFGLSKLLKMFFSVPYDHKYPLCTLVSKSNATLAQPLCLKSL